jgi:hypothetical protein
MTSSGRERADPRAAREHAVGGAPLAAFLEAAVPLWLVAATAGLDSADWSGGTTFAGRHWCAAQHNGCPGPGKAGEPTQVVRELTGRGFDHE